MFVISGGDKMDRKIWEDPIGEKSLDQSQTPLWFWNDKLENEELVRQLKMQTDAGVRCTIPHARRNFGEGYIGGYLDEDWFDKMKTVLEYKKSVNERCGFMTRLTGRQEPVNEP